MSMGWRLEVPEWNLDLKMTPDFVEQMVRFPLNGDFWEGSIHVNGTINGKRVSGKSFGELMHRFETPEIKFEKVSINKKDKVVKVKWNIKNSDAGNPLSYDIDILENDNLTTLIKNTRNNYLSIPFSKFNNKSGKVQVRAHSIDNTISNTSTTKQIKL
jgi:hypothetical protein